AEEVRGAAAAADLADALRRLADCGADAELVRLTTHCLAASPDERPTDGRAVADAVAAYRAGVQERLRQAEIDRATAQARATFQRRRRRLTVGLGVTLLALVGLAAGGGVWKMHDWEVKRAAEAERVRREQERDREAGAALEDAEKALRRSAWAEARASLERA